MKPTTFYERAEYIRKNANRYLTRYFDSLLLEGGKVQNVYRKINKKHRCSKSVGNTVNVKKATYTNSIGDALMMVYWKDPKFDPKQRAFYYVRVLEIPTPRWTTYDAAFFGVDLPKDVPASQQERAYTSPIWYSP